MNYLGHLLLTEPTREGLLGAILGDFVKGPLVGKHDARVERAIALHRAVDTFTDNHPAVRQCMDFISPLRRRYAGILIDIFFDHFLVWHWHRYASEPLDALVDKTYHLLSSEQHWFPDRLRAIARRIVEQDWLRSYGDRDAVDRTLRRMSTRHTRRDAMGGRHRSLAEGIIDLDTCRAQLEAGFHRFLPDAIAYARLEIHETRGRPI